MNSQVTIFGTKSYAPIRVSKYRWVILLVFGIISIVNFMQLLQFSIIANIIIKYYNVQSYFVDMTVLIFFVSFIVFFYPQSYLVGKYSLKFTLIKAAIFTLTGNLLKLLATTPDRFWLILIAQFLISIGQVYLCCVPSKLANTWFGANEVSTACAIAVLWIQLGSALGCVQSPSMVTSDGSDHDEMKSQLFNMFLYQAIASVCAFAIVLIFFRSRPSLPPSQSQLNLITNNVGIDTNFVSDMKKIAKNKNFWYIVFSLGLANGVWNSFGVLTNKIYLNFFPNRESDVGLVGLITIISGGCIGSMFFGIILDKTHHFKRVSFIILVASAVSYIFVALSMMEKSRIGTFIAIPIFGFFVAPVLIVGFEYLVEVTYPIPESYSTSIFNAAYYFLAILATLLYEALFDAIGYLYTFVVIVLMLSLCALIVLRIDSDLKRRDANLQHNVTNGHIGNGYTNATISSTTVTVARF